MLSIIKYSRTKPIIPKIYNHNYKSYPENLNQYIEPNYKFDDKIKVCSITNKFPGDWLLQVQSAQNVTQYGSVVGSDPIWSSRF
jgi:hypothetical protein